MLGTLACYANIISGFTNWRVSSPNPPPRISAPPGLSPRPRRGASDCAPRGNRYYLLAADSILNDLCLIALVAPGTEAGEGVSIAAAAAANASVGTVGTLGNELAAAPGRVRVTPRGAPDSRAADASPAGCELHADASADLPRQSDEYAQLGGGTPDSRAVATCSSSA